MEGRARVREGRALRYIDRSGQKVGRSEFEDGGDFINGLAVVVTTQENRRMHRYLDTEGEFAHTEANYESALSYREGLAPVRRVDRVFYAVAGPLCLVGFIRRSVCHRTEVGPWTYVNRAGMDVIDRAVAPELDLENQEILHATAFSEGVAAVAIKRAFYEADQWGYIDTTGTFVIAPTYLTAFPFYEGRARVVDDTERFGYIRADGSEVVAPRYLTALNFNEGVAGVETEEGWGFIDLDGTVVIPAGYDAVLGFAEGMAAVQRDGRWRFVDRTGTPAIERRFDYVTPFRNGLAYVRDGGVEGYIDRSGAFVWERGN